MKILCFTVTLLGTLLVGLANAGTLTQVSSVSALGPNDSFDWDTSGLGALPNGTSLTTAKGLLFAASNAQNNLSVSNAASFFSSNGGTDDFLFAPIQAPQAILISLGAPVSGFGAAPEWGGFEVATYTMSVYGAGNVLLGTFTANSGSQGNPAFIGVTDTLSEITSVQFSYDGPTAPHSAALGDLSLIDSAVPEPGSLILVAPAVLMGLFVRSRARRKTIVS